MIKKLFLLCFIGLLGAGCDNAEEIPETVHVAPKPVSGRTMKVLYVDSYHRGYEWSDGITAGILREFNVGLNDDDTTDDSESDVRFKLFRMDTKRNKKMNEKEKAARRAKELIDSWKPDVVIASDDNAAKFLIREYYKDSALPFVFCGINWSADEYGFPCSNVTGMIEQALASQLVDHLLKFSDGTEVSFLAPDVTSQRREAYYWEKHLRIRVNAKYVNTFDEWKQAFVDLQKTNGVLIVRNLSGLKDADIDQAREWVEKHTIIPTGGTVGSTSQLALITLAKDPREFGRWSAHTARRILGGISPTDIPVEVNRKASIFLNMRLAKKLGVTFSMDMIEDARIIAAE